MKILDMCCGGKLFYYDTKNKDITFCDIRKGKYEFTEGRNVEVLPDIVCDFRELPFLGLARKFNGIDRNFYVREDFISPFRSIYESVDYIQKNVIRLYVKDEYLAICALAGLEREGE